MMSILTPKMLTARYQAPSSCKVWFPFNEGTGNTITDLINGAVQADNATSNHDTPHAILFTATGTIESGSLPGLPIGKSLIMLDVIQSGLLSGAGNAFTIGATGVDQQGYGFSAGFTISTGVSGDTVSQTTANFQTQTNDEKFVRLGTYNGVTGLISTYSGNDGASAGPDNTADGSAHVGRVIPDQTALAIGSSGIDDVQTYSAVVYVVDRLPSESTLLAAADWAYTNWTNGIKVPPPQFADLT